MKEIVFVGLGLNDEKGISIQGLEEIKSAENVFIELYTNLMPNFSLDNLKHMSKKQPYILSRHELEEDNGEVVLKAAENGKTIFLVPGDPLIATTHITLRLEAKKRKLKTRIVHGTSVISAIMGYSGLHNYKFGKTVTIPLPDNFSETPYKVIMQNKKFGLHTLCLLDINTKKEQFLSINEALKLLLDIEEKRKQQIITPNTIVVGIARIGSSSQILKADYLIDLLDFDFGDPPQSLIFPGKLHFMEVEALIAFGNASRKLKEHKQ
jgi:diphthine synthase